MSIENPFFKFLETKAARKNENPFSFNIKWLTCLKDTSIFVLFSDSNNNPFEQVNPSVELILPKTRTSSNPFLIIVFSIKILVLSRLLSIWHEIFVSPTSLPDISQTNEVPLGYK